MKISSAVVLVALGGVLAAPSNHRASENANLQEKLHFRDTDTRRRPGTGQHVNGGDNDSNSNIVKEIWNSVEDEKITDKVEEIEKKLLKLLCTLSGNQYPDTVNPDNQNNGGKNPKRHDLLDTLINSGGKGVANGHHKKTATACKGLSRPPRNSP